MHRRMLIYLTVIAGTCPLTRESSAGEPPITALTFAPDGQSVAAVSQAGIQVLGWPDLTSQRTIKAAAANLHCLAFSPTGTQLAVGGGDPAEDGSVAIFAWPSGELVATLGDHDDSVLAIAWRDASTLISASLDRDIKLWDVPQSSSVLTCQGHSRGVSALCVLNDGKTLVSAGIDQSVRVWDLHSGELARQLSQHTGPVHALALRPGEGGLPMVASAAGDRTIRFWQPTIGRMVRFVRLDSEPLDVAWLNEGARIAAACVDGRVRVVDADAVRVTRSFAAIDGWAYAIAVHPTDGSVAVGGSGGEVRRIADPLHE